MIRATTGGVLRSYRSDLMKSFISLNNARDTVLTQRNFNSYAEDPAAASKAFQLRKSRMSVETQYNINDDVYRKYQTAWSCLDTTSKLIDTENGTSLATLKGTTLKMLNDPTGDARKTLSTTLNQMSETIVQTMNQKYGDNFIFAGADGHNVPFEVVDNKLYYRGVPVDADEPKVLLDDAGEPLVNANGDYVLETAATFEKLEFTDDGTGTNTSQVGTSETGEELYLLKTSTALNETEFAALKQSDPAAADGYTKVELDPADPTKVAYWKTEDTVSKDSYDAKVDDAMKGADNTTPLTIEVDGKEYYIVNDKESTITQDDYNAAVDAKAKLDYLVNEKNFVDIGLGFQENTKGQLIESSGFNAALNGLTFLGYGLDEDGDPKNIYSLVQRMKDVADRVKDGENWTDEDYDEFYGLVQKLEDASSEFKTQYTNMDAGTTKLKNNLGLLEENFYNLQEQYAALEDVDMADSITSFVWAQYCYNAALKVGNNVLSESLMDYLN